VFSYEIVDLAKFLYFICILSHPVPNDDCTVPPLLAAVNTMDRGPGKKAPPTSNAMIINSDGPQLEEHDVGKSEQQDTFIQSTRTQDVLVLSDNKDGGGIENVR
jgi:hypothetical protein